MSKSELAAIVALYRPLILGDGAKDPDGALLRLATEIERQCRADAAGLAFALANRLATQAPDAPAPEKGN